MGNFDSMNISHDPEKRPVAEAPIFDEQKENDKMLLQELRRLLDEEEDPVAQYALVDKIVDLEMKEYYGEAPDIQEETSTPKEITSTPIAQIENDDFKRVDPWEDLGYHKGFENNEFPHPNIIKKTKTPEEKEIAKKRAIEKIMAQRRANEGKVDYSDPQDPTL